MRVEVLRSEPDVARRAAEWIAASSHEAARARGRFLLARSGGRVAGALLAALAGADVAWDVLHLFQADERVAPEGDPDRHLTRLRDALLGRVGLAPERVHAMPVEADDLDAAARRYAAVLEAVAGRPPVLDLVHLGLGADGHTASLVPGDPAVEETEADVAATGPYQGRRRLTLTRPALDRARRLLWVVTGREKAPALRRLRAGDASIPAGRVRRDRAVLLADAAAASGADPGP